MPALEMFEDIARQRSRIEKAKLDIAELESRIVPHAQGFEPTGHGTSDPDRMTRAAIISMQVGNLRELIPLMERRLEARIERATHVLYGRSGRGGLAKERCTMDADILCCHYLQGMRWVDVAAQIVKPDTDYPVQWCRQRAIRACTYIDRIGMDVLVDS